MRYSLFEILAWTTFIAICCAALAPMQRGSAILLIGWFTVTIAMLKLFGRQAACFASLSIAVALSVLDAMTPLNVSPSHHTPFIEVLLAGIMIYGSFALLIWVFMIGVDSLILFLQRRIMRKTEDG